jgi:hypothetical protein
MATKAMGKKPRGAYHHGDLKGALKAAALRLVKEKGARGFHSTKHPGSPGSRWERLTAISPTRTRSLPRSHVPNPSEIQKDIPAGALDAKTGQLCYMVGGNFTSGFPAIDMCTKVREGNLDLSR